MATFRQLLANLLQAISSGCAWLANVLGYLVFRNPWAGAMSGLGLGWAVLVWTQRGPMRVVIKGRRLLAFRWCLCAWGAFEGIEGFVCHGLMQRDDWVAVRAVGDHVRGRVGAMVREETKWLIPP